MTAPVIPISKAAADDTVPVEVCVSVNHVLDRVVVTIGDRAIGLPHAHAALLCERLLDAIAELRRLGAQRKQ